MNSRQVRFEHLEPRMLLSGLPYGAVPQDTGEFMLGDVVATVVFFESDGSIDENQEDWNPLKRDAEGNVVFDSSGRTINAADGPNLIEETKQRIIEGLEWWEETLDNFYQRNYGEVDPVHSLNFIYDFEYAHNPIATGYEPINRKSSEYSYWVGDFLAETGFLETGVVSTDIRTFNNAQRLKHDADWAYTIFVANDYNDPNGMFAVGGRFLMGFAFSGGRHFVSPARRPASTFAHETGHIFYARDEYSMSGAHYTDRRGYYNSQNWNAYDNPTSGFVQQDSIMDSSSELDAAWVSNTSSDSSLAMIGWQDSDSDGVFDVLDVPLTLTGTGYYNPHDETYHFRGHSATQALVNVNSSGRGNDITINEVDRLVYSLNGGLTWRTAESYDDYEVDIDVTLPVEPGQEVWIRTESVDPITGEIVATSSDVFRADTTLPATVSDPGISGFVWDDRDEDGHWDQKERGIPGRHVQLVDGQGEPVETAQRLDPNDFTSEWVLNSTLPGVTLSATGWDANNGRVGALDLSGAPGERVFGLVRSGLEDVWTPEWTSESRVLKIDFENPTTFVKIDAIGASADSCGRLEIYDAADNMLGRTTSRALSEQEVEALSIGVPTPRIAYALVRSTVESTVMLDNLQVGPSGSAVTEHFGAYSLPYLPPGDYHLKAVRSGGGENAASDEHIAEVTVGANGQMLWPEGTDRPSDFAVAQDPETSALHNVAFNVDVNDDWRVSPIDALLVISYLNARVSQDETPEADGDGLAFVDVSGDGSVSPVDALMVISRLNATTHSGAASSEHDSLLAWSAEFIAGAGAEGEAVLDVSDHAETVGTRTSLDGLGEFVPPEAASGETHSVATPASPPAPLLQARPGSARSSHSIAPSLVSTLFKELGKNEGVRTRELLDSSSLSPPRERWHQPEARESESWRFELQAIDEAVEQSAETTDWARLNHVRNPKQFDELLAILAAEIVDAKAPAHDVSFGSC